MKNRTHTRVIEETRPGLKEYGIDVVFDHQPPRLFNTPQSFGVRDWNDAVGHGLERTDRTRNRTRLILWRWVASCGAHASSLRADRPDTDKPHRPHKRSPIREHSSSPCRRGIAL